MATLIRGGSIFHGDPPEMLAGDLLLADGSVVGEQATTLEKVRVIDAEGCLVLPGFVIAHHHLYSTLARGMPGPSKTPSNFREVLEQVWWRLDQALDLDLVEQSAWAGSMDAMAAGATAIVDHHASPRAIEGSLDRIATGLARTGLRGVLCYESSNRHGAENFEAGLAENSRFCGQPQSNMLRAMVGGHAPFTLEDQQLAKLASLAQKHDVAVHLHVAEARDDQEDARSRGASNVTERLAQNGVLDGRLVLAHGVHLHGDEVARLQSTDTYLTHQPRSNMNNHVGYLKNAAAFEPRVALGTDGINGDLFDEAHAAFFRLREHDGQAGAERVWSWLAGSWRLLSACFGLAEQQGFGWLWPGCPADVVVLDYDSPTPVHAGNLAWHLAFGIGARHVRDVIVAGEVRMRDRKPAAGNTRELRKTASAAAERLWARMGEI
jgi:putative selenium metabolism protein SsnA